MELSPSFTEKAELGLKMIGWYPLGFFWVGFGMDRAWVWTGLGLGMDLLGVSCAGSERAVSLVHGFGRAWATKSWPVRNLVPTPQPWIEYFWDDRI